MQSPFLHWYPCRFSRVNAHPSRRCLLRLLTLENVLVHCGVRHESLFPRGWWSREAGLDGDDAATLPTLLELELARPEDEPLDTGRGLT